MKKFLISILILLGVSTGGYLGGGFYNRSNTNKAEVDTLTTTEVTTTTIRTIPMSVPTSTTHIVANIIANGIGGAITSTLGGGWHCVADFKITGTAITNTVAQVGTTICDSNVSSGLGVDFITSTASVLLRINGLTSSTFNWESYVETYRVQ